MNQPPPRDVPNWSTRQVVYATLFIISVVVAFYLLYRFSRVAFILFVAIVLGTAIRPAVDWLNQRGIPRSIGVVIVYLAILAVIVGVILLVVPLIANQVASIAEEVPNYYNNFRGELFQTRSWILQRIAIQLPADISILSEPAPSGEEGTLDRVAQFFAYSGTLSRGILAIVSVFLLGFYWTLESERTIRSLLLWLPLNRREDIRELISQIETKVGGFIVGQSILCLSIGIMAFIAYMLIGLPYALVLAIIAGIMEAVPVLGPILGAVPALFVALATSPALALWVLVATAIIQLSENSILVPKIMNRSVGVNPTVTLLALAAFTSLLGLPGALLAVPMAAIIQLILDRFVLTPEPVEAQAQEVIGRDQLSLLRYEAQGLAQDVRKQLRQKDNTSDELSDEIEDTIEALANDLDRILAQAAQGEVQE
jgi:predicted PurR-regulated permease PerM